MIMQILNDISENLQKGKAKAVKELVQTALDEGVTAKDILGSLLAGMGVIGEKFKNNEVYVPEVLVAARAMNVGAQILKPYLAESEDGKQFQLMRIGYYKKCVNENGKLVLSEIVSLKDNFNK